MGAICLQDPECLQRLRLVGPLAVASPEHTHSPHRPTWGPQDECPAQPCDRSRLLPSRRP